MKKNTYLKLLFSSIAILMFSFFLSKTIIKKKEKEELLSKRKKLENFIKNSPYKETLTWDKKKRKQNGLPPNRYFEQMWELTINPETGKLDDGELNELRKKIMQKRVSRKTPGNTSNAWEERGPNNVGGRTRVIMFDPNDTSNNTVYAGGVSGGLWKNTNISNANSQWSRVQNVPGNLSVTSITVDPRNSNRWYVGTGEQYTAGDVVGNGVYVTTDGGNNWSAVTIPAAGPDSFDYNASNLFLKGIYYVNDVLAWDNGNSTELFVAVGAHVYGDSSSPKNWLGLQSAGIYRSTNNGSSWSRIESSNLSYSFGGSTYYYIPNDLEVGADNKLWMGTIGSALGEGGGRVYSSTNGSTWTEANASPLTDSNRVELEPSATNGNKIYALTQGVNSPVHIYETTNSFSSITSKALPNDADTGISANDFTRGQAFYDLVIEADPANDNIIYVGGIDLFKSTNGGSSWSQLSHWYGGFGQPNNVHADQHSIAFGNNDASKVLFGNDGGIYYSGNSGNSINSRNNNYNVTQFVKASIGPDGVGDLNGIFSAGAQDNGTQAFRDANTANGINSSEDLSDGDGFYTFVDKDGQYMIATYVFNVIYRFNLPWNGQGRIDGGATTLSSDQSTGDFVNPMDYDSNANRLLSNQSTTSSNSILSINVASNSKGSLTNAALTSSPTAFRASPFENNAWYVGLSNGGLVKLTNVTNNSATFTTVNNPFVGAISSIRLGETANDLIVTIHNYGVTSIWYSSNAGSTWSSKEGNLPNIPVRDFLLNPLAPNEAIIATQLGVWSTENFNDTNPNWSQSYNGMSDVSVTSLDYWNVSGDNTNNKIIASTYGRGVFTGTFTSSSAPDTEAPTTPTNLITNNITENSIQLSWSSSTDNVGVTNYDIYRNGNLLTTVTNTSYTATSLSANTNYNFYVIAKDSAGNSSVKSITVNATTLAPDTTAPTAPTALVSNNKTDTSVNLSWTASTDNVAVTSYDVLNGSTVVGNTANTSFTVNGLTSNTSYSFSVIAKDDAGNISTASNTLTVTTDVTPINYCASQSSNVNDEFISNVQLGSINNNSGAQFYSDFTSISTNLIKGDNYTVTVTPTWTGTKYNEGYAVWIDFNKDGDFTDANEQVLSVAPNQNATVSASFTVPSSALETSTRMRVSMSYNAIPTSCQSFSYGEVEDYTVNIQAASADTIAPIITLNGASTLDLNVGNTYSEQGATATDNVDGNLTSNIIITGNVDTNTAGTYIKNYNVSDNAGNAAAQISRTINVNAISTSDCVNGISTFPYTESFEGNIGAWSQSSSDDIDWSINSNGTPSGSTGPSSATNGNSYIFVEASGDGTGYPNKQAILNSPCFDLTNETSANFSFNYHMYGAADMGTIALEISTDNGTNWTNIWSESGNKGNQWLSANINLNAFIGSSIQLRFNRITGSTWQADIALDNIELYSDSSNNNGCTAEVTSFPYNEGFEGNIGSWSQNSNDDLNWIVDANGTPSNNTGPSSATEGNSYLFVEASGNNTGYPTKQAILTSPCFDLSSLSAASFNFNYHMYGATNMGTLDVEISNDNGASWSSIWTESGNKGNQWLSASVDLSAYLGNNIQLRFNRVTGNTWQADVAIDNVSLNNVAASNNISIVNNDNFFNTTDGSFKIYPSPVKTLLNVQLSTNTVNSYKIINSIGQTIKSGKLQNNSIEVSNLKIGMYLLEISDGEEKLIKKFIKI